MAYFPKLKAHQLKKIIIDSGIKVNSKVMLDYDKEIEFDELSKSGKMVNLYNALIYAANKKYK